MQSKAPPPRRFLRDNSLSLVIFGLFFALLFVAQMLTGERDHNEDRREHGRPPLSMKQYLRSDHFLEATMENWESEFLQMAAFIILSAMLFQRGSAESRDPDTRNEEINEDPAAHRLDPRAPWPVRRGGPVLLWLYSHSLSGAFLLLFLLSFWLHALGGVGQYNEEETLHGGTPLNIWQFMATSKFWFQSFQNWQSEFLAIGCMIVFSIWLRERGSPESKPVHAPHDETGK